MAVVPIAGAGQEIRSIENGTKRRSAYNQLVQTEGYEDLSSVSRVDEAECAMQAWEMSHPDKCEMKRDDGQFFGFRQVGQAHLERYTRFVFVPAVRDAGKEASDARGSVIFELMQLMVRSVLAQSKAFAEFKHNAQEQYNELIKPENVPQLAQLGEQLTKVLIGYVPNSAVHLVWDNSAELNIPDPKSGVLLEEDGFKAPVSMVGHGLQRAFILSLLQSLAAAQAEYSNNNDESNEAKEHEPIPDLILAIEEPELYQHPNRQRHFSNVLLSLATGHIAGVADRTQVLCCTHSPLFIDLERFDSIRRLTKTKNQDDPNLPLITHVISTDASVIAKRLSDAQDDIPALAFTAESLKARFATLITPWTNEGFFADVIVLVEGVDDRSAILGQAIQMKEHDLEARGIAIIPCRGKANIDRLYLIFAELGVPTYIVFDGDKNKNEGASTNRSLQRLLGLKTIADYPTTFVNERYAVFEDNLNDTIRNMAGDKIYHSVHRDFQDNYGYGKLKECEKSPLFIKSVLEKASLEGKECNELKQIVEKILLFTSNAIK